MTAVELLVNLLDLDLFESKGKAENEINKILHIEKQQIKDAYNQGYREGLEECKQLRDVSECSNADSYYNEIFKK